MLRRIASQPALRHGGSTATVRPPMPANAAFRIPNRSLVSTVLLTRDAYESKRVADLKTELKQRGLTTAGKRSDLIQRLVDSDVNRAKVLPTGVAGPALAASKNQTAAARKARPASTSAPRAAAPSSSAPPSPSEGHVGGLEEGVTISHPPDMEPGQVSNNAADVLDGQTLVADADAAPGVPASKQPRAPIVFNVKIPYEEPEPEYGAEIPVMTPYFNPENKTFSGYNPEDGPVAHVPKVRTVSGEDTYHGGGVSHHHPIFEESHVIGGPVQGGENAQTEVHSLRSAVQSVLSTMQKDLGLHGEESKEGSSSAAETASKAADTTKSLFRDARENLSSAFRSGGGSGGSGSGSASYSTSSASYSGEDYTRQLNSDEQRGLYVLGGIVVGGFLLGGLGKPSRRKIAKVRQEIAQKAEEAKQASSKGLVNDVELASLVGRAEAALRQ